MIEKKKQMTLITNQILLTTIREKLNFKVQKTNDLDGMLLFRTNLTYRERIHIRHDIQLNRKQAFLFTTPIT